LENVATKTLPFTTVGATNLAKLPKVSRSYTMSLFHSSVSVWASKACRVPGTGLTLWSPVVSQTIADWRFPPLEETAMPS